MSKDVHIVFQVLNFLHGDSDLANGLFPNECRLLINLASHKGVKGIYPSLTTIGKELKLSRRHLMRIIKSLEKKNLIYLERNLGRSNRYHLSPKLSTTRDTHVTSDILTSDTHVTGTRDTHVTPPVTPMSPYITKEVTKLNNRERSKVASLPSLSVDNFKPDQKNIDLVQQRGLEMNVVLGKFIALCKRDGKKHKDWQAAFEMFALSERPPTATLFGKTNSIATGSANTTYGSMRDFTAERLARQERERNN